MAENVLQILLLSGPILLGIIVWLAKPAAAIDLVDRYNCWLSAESAKLDNSSSRLVRYWIRPVSRVALRLVQVTGRIADPFLCCGVRVAIFPYMLVAAVFGAFIVLYFIIIIFIFRAALMIWAIWDSIFGERGPKARPRAEPKAQPENPNPTHGLTAEKIVEWHNYGERDAAAGRMKHEPWAGPFEPHEVYEARRKAYQQGYNHALGQKDGV